MLQQVQPNLTTIKLIYNKTEQVDTPSRDEITCIIAAVDFCNSAGKSRTTQVYPPAWVVLEL